MCGIAAILAGAHRGLAAHIAGMTALVRHRGPDDEGYALFDGPALEPSLLGGADTPQAVWESGLPFAPRARMGAAPAAVALGHRRLSIVDLSPGGHQPMSTPEGDLWIVYNGEIYNHTELRAELAKLGHRFGSTSDTEVILAAWKRWGRGCLERFNGMFAFVLIDRNARTLTAVRDRFGVKPLYFWRSPQGALAVASEIKQLTALPGWSARAQSQAVYDYLVWGLFDHTAQTLFEGVEQLRGGELFTVSIDRPGPPVERERWYTLRPRPFEGDAAEAAQAFRATFADAVGLRLRSDVPIGSCLSGGLDSSSIVCMANQLQRAGGVAAAHKTFSAGSREARYDERRYAEVVIAAAGTDARFVYPESHEALAAIEQLTWHQDEPFGSSSIYAQWCVFASAAQHGIKVMLDGQGADEHLAGYPGFLGPRLRDLATSLSLGTLIGEFVAAGRHPSLGYRYAAQQLANVLLPDRLRQRLRAHVSRPSVNPAWLDVARLGAIDREPFARLPPAASAVVGLSMRLLLETGLPMLLHTEDRNSMAHSVESRLPFLDFRLVELVLGMPDEYKWARAVSKRVLREAMRGLLPDPILGRRDKLGFATAEEVWLKTSARATFRSYLSECVRCSGGVVRESVLQDLDAIAEGRRPFDFRLWRLINFGVWLRRFDVALA